MNDNRLTPEDIEHKVIDAQVKGIVIQMNANFEVVNGVLRRMEITAKETLDQTKLTNGRVTKLEEDIEVVTFLKKYKFIFAVMLIGFFKIYEALDFQQIYAKLLNFIF